MVEISMNIHEILEKEMDNCSFDALRKMLDEKLADETITDFHRAQFKKFYPDVTLKNIRPAIKLVVATIRKNNEGQQ